MPTKIRKIIFLVLGSLLFVTILNLVFGMFRFPFIPVDPFQAIPKHSSIIVESKSNIDLLNDLEVIGDLKDFPLYDKLQEDIEMITNLLDDSSTNKGNYKTLLSLQKVGAENLDFLYIFDIRNTDFLKKEIKGNFKIKDLNFQGTKYQKILIDSQDEFTFYRYRNLILLSRYPVLVEDGIRQLNTYQSNLTLDRDFKKAIKNKSVEGLVNFYINLKTLPKEIRSFLKYKDQKILKALPNFASWITFEFQDSSFSSIKGKYITSQPFQTRKNLKGVSEMEILKAIPDNTGFLFAQQGVSLKGMKDTLFQEYIQPWISDEWAFSIINPRTSADRLLILKTDDREVTQHYLERFGKLQGKLLESNYQTYALNRWLENDCIAPFLNHLQLEMSNPYFTILDQCVIFSNSRQSLESVIDKYIVGQTIFQNEDFLKYLNGVSDKSNGIFYFDGAAIGPIVNKMLTKHSSKTLKSSIFSNLEKMNGGCELYNGRGEVDFEFIGNSKKVNVKHTAIAWKTAFSADVIGEPKTLWNSEKEEYEILVFDRQHNLYMLNNSGEILWKKALRDTLLSDIHQIDYHEDGSLKLLFNTTNNIYLVDKEGKDIGNYPLRLQSPAVNGMCVVDFKGDKKYQLFLACNNGKAYGFTKEGNPIYGWNPKNNIGNVVQPFQHFRNGKEDYIIILNDEGKLASFDKEGKRIIKRLALGDSYNNTPAILSIGNRKVIALANNQGEVKIINNRGDAYHLALKNNPSNDRVQSTFANITGDQKKDFVTLSKNKVACYSQEKKQLKQEFEIELKDPQDEIFEVEIPKVDYSYFGTLCNSKKQINLFNAQNALHKDFPIAGTTTFSIIDLFKNGSNILLVGYDNSLYAYQLNTIE